MAGVRDKCNASGWPGTKPPSWVGPGTEPPSWLGSPWAVGPSGLPGGCSMKPLKTCSDSRAGPSRCRAQTGLDFSLVLGPGAGRAGQEAGLTEGTDVAPVACARVGGSVRRRGTVLETRASRDWDQHLACGRSTGLTRLGSAFGLWSGSDQGSGQCAGLVLGLSWACARQCRTRWGRVWSRA